MFVHVGGNGGTPPLILNFDARRW